MKLATKRIICCIVIPPFAGVVILYLVMFLFFNVVDIGQPLPPIRISLKALANSLLLITIFTLLPSLIMALVFERLVFRDDRWRARPSRAILFGAGINALTALAMSVIVLVTTESAESEMNVTFAVIFMTAMTLTGFIVGAMTGWAVRRLSRRAMTERNADVNASSESSS